MRDIRIISNDVFGRTARVLDAVTGEPIEGVAAIDLHMDVHNITTAVITYCYVTLDVVAQEVEVRDRMRAVLAAHGRVHLDDLDQVLDELEHALHGGEPT